MECLRYIERIFELPKELNFAIPEILMNPPNIENLYFTVTFYSDMTIFYVLFHSFTLLQSGIGICY